MTGQSSNTALFHSLPLLLSFAQLTLCQTEEEEKERKNKRNREKEAGRRERVTKRMFSVSLKCRMGVIRRRIKGTECVCDCQIAANYGSSMSVSCLFFFVGVCVCVLGDCWHMLDQNIMVCIFVNTLNSIFMQLFWKKYLVVFVSLFPGVVAFRHVCVETCVPSYCSSKLYPSAAAL